MSRFVPRPYQESALRKIDNKRKSGGKKSLIVMASGLGKTALAAYDVRRWLKRNGGRVLYLCHQNEILAQARATFQEVIGPNFTYGYFHGGEKTPGNIDILFSSFQTMHALREEFSPRAFKYVVVDESHHSQAGTYLPTLQYFRPQFMLALTATPDRADLKDIRDIYGPEDYSLPLEEAIARGLLTNVDYRLLSDELQNLQILETPVGKLSINELNRRLFVPKRDDEIVRIINEHTAGIRRPRVVVFCPSIRYANRLAELMPHASALHSKASQAFHDEAMKRFRTGELSTILTVDKFNEGIDVPEANLIVFLRSTASQTIFLQQLGRGLRRVPGKRKVVVLDFVANCERLEMVHHLWTKVREEYEHDYKGAEEDSPITVNVGKVEFDETILSVLDVIAGIRTGYTKEILIKQIKDLAQILGRTPYTSDIQDASKAGHTASPITFTSAFGSWTGALAAAGFSPNRRFDNKEAIVEQLQQLSNELGRTPTGAEIDEASSLNKCASLAYIVKLFGSWKLALLAAGLPISWQQRYSDEELLESLRSLGKKLGRTPTAGDVVLASKQGKCPSPDSIIRRFGKYTAALEAAGFTTNRAYTCEELVSHLKKLAKELGLVPTLAAIEEYRKKNGGPPTNQYYLIFGSFTAALKAAGFGVRLRKQYSDEELLSQLRLFAKQLGRTPMQREIKAASERGVMAGPTTLSNRFGSLTIAMKQAGLKPNPPNRK